MLDAAAIGLIVGFLGRAGPELLKFADRHLDRRHELAMQDKALEFEKMRGPGSKAGERDLIDAGQLQEVFGLMREAYSQQFNTGNPTLNAISILVRPTTTAFLLWLYIGVKIAMVFGAFATSDHMTALGQAYGDMDVTILSGVLAFWFASRSLTERK